MSGLPSTPAAALGSGISAVELPTRFRVSHGPGIFELSWRWRDQVTWRDFYGPMAGLTIVGAQLPNLVHMWHSPGLIVGVGAVGGVVAYKLAQWRMNTVTIRAAQGMLTLRHAPVPAPTLEIAVDDIHRLALAAPPKKKRKNVKPRWGVLVELRNGKRRALVGSILAEEQARFIAEQIEQALGIPPSSSTLAP